MKVKTWMPLVLAVVLGLLAAWLVRNQMSNKPGVAEHADLVATVTAITDIEPGKQITAADVATVNLPPDAVPAGSFRSAAELGEGRVALFKMVKGQPVLESTLAPTGTAAGVQALIPPGMRAITLQVSEFSGVAGLLIPGSKVDIISVIRNDEVKGSVARTIVQNVEVRAIGRQITPPQTAMAPNGQPDPGAPPVPVTNNVTLLVTPEQAEAVQLASVGGSPWLVLRNSTDQEPVESDGTSMADLRGDSSTSPLDQPIEEPTKLTGLDDPFADKGEKVTTKVETPKTRTVKFIRATKEEQMTVEVAPPPPTDWMSTTTTATTDGAPVDGK